jgi:hypothetical protein
MTKPTLPATHSFMVYEPELDEQRLMAAALGYSVAEVPVLPKYYVTWNKIERVPPSLPALGELVLDVSRWNWPVDYQAAKAAGVKRVYARATIGANGVDEQWVNHRNAILDAGLPLGAYHYFIWNEDPLRQAENFKRVTLDFCTEGPVVDAERRRNRIDPANPTGDKLPELVDKPQASANLLSLLNAIGGADQPPAGIYTSKNEWEAMFSLSAESVAKWWKWLAHYKNGAARWPEPLHLAVPDAPAGWWARLHQYRVAEPGELSWHPRALDLNVYRGETPPVVVPPPVPVPAPLFRARVKSLSNLRDRAGNQMVGADGGPVQVPGGATVDVWAVLPSIGPNALGQSFVDRWALAPDGRNLWSVNLERL